MDLDYDFISPKDDFSSLYFTEKDGTDPLGVDDFVKQKSIAYHDSKLSTVRIVRYRKNIVGYFAVSMSAISIEDLQGGEKVAQATPIRYPAMLLGQLGVDKNCQGQGIGTAICDFCLGLAQVIGEKIACRYIILQTSSNKTKLYEKMGFTKSPKSKTDKIWMYRRVA